jgi:transaldolase
MEFIIDTVNLEDIKEAVEYMPIVGVTSNPSIVKKTSPKDFFQHMKEVRKIIGKERSLFKLFLKNVMKSLKKPIVLLKKSMIKFISKYLFLMKESKLLNN